jgi:hypothetical protein
VNICELGILGLAVAMLATGIVALARPSVHVLLAEAVVSILLFRWNVGVIALNASIGHGQTVNGHD